jgi:hypothetical protein
MPVHRGVCNGSIYFFHDQLDAARMFVSAHGFGSGDPTLQVSLFLFFKLASMPLKCTWACAAYRLPITDGELIHS